MLGEAYSNGSAAFDKGDFDAAIVAFSEASRLDPRTVWAY